jgi:hypothetical protein
MTGPVDCFFGILLFYAEALFFKQRRACFFHPDHLLASIVFEVLKKTKTTNLIGQPASRHKKQLSPSPKSSEPWPNNSKNGAKNVKKHFRDAAISFCFFGVKQPQHQSAPRGLDSEQSHIDWQPSPKVLFS